MAIFQNGKEVEYVYVGNKVISTVYYGARVVWEAIRSCFGRGYWINAYPWDNDDKWANNN